MFNVRSFGAVGDGTQLDTAAIQAAIDKWFEAAETASRAKTDEVGTKMSEYVKTHPGSTGH